jgi:hypothetical protein
MARYFTPNEAVFLFYFGANGMVLNILGLKIGFGRKGRVFCKLR